MYVYLITNRINGKRYVGQTVNDIDHRWSQHVAHSKTPKKSGVLCSAIRKHGSENFEIKLLSRCNSIEEMNHRETYYIKLFRSLCPAGYNLDSGGKNSLMHPETKKKLSIAHTGKKRGPQSIEHKRKRSEALKGRNKGIPLSEETKRKISEANSGQNNYMFGKKQTENNKQATAKANKRNKYWVGRKHNSESKEKMSKSRIGKYNGDKNPFFGKKHSQENLEKLLQANEKRKVGVFCINNSTKYYSISDASKDLNIDRSQIRDVMNGKAKSAKGFVFRKV